MCVHKYIYKMHSYTQTYLHQHIQHTFFQDVSVVSDHGVMKIVIPDEKNGSIVTRTLPIRPGTTTREVCKMMAHKLKVTNPQDYALYKLVDGLGKFLSNSFQNIL